MDFTRTSERTVQKRSVYENIFWHRIVERMFEDVRYVFEGPGIDNITQIKCKVYGRILEHIRSKNIPAEGDADFKEANVNHLVYTIIVPILDNFISQTQRKNTQLKCEKEIISKDGGETGGSEETVDVDMASVEKILSSL
ncbi:hypothetical protein BDZ91DRAFT_111751 [Kalaharituber pfeilii]|nr:hypothetical protein BDZ91DRAFT_111751 [Kalaharituber pfeilii]